MTSITIDPRDFIGLPYWCCPRCGNQAFRVLITSFSRNSYQRRCRGCLHMSYFRLPTIKKKVIYLDQFFISSILKLRTPAMPGHSKIAAEPFWTEVDDLLRKLSGLQLICCPDSGEQENESLVTPFFRALRTTYKSFSGGISFHLCDDIRLQQIRISARAWAKQEEPEYSFDAVNVASTNPHGWNDRIFVVVETRMEEFADEVRLQRKRAHEGYSSLFKHLWRLERRSFKEWFDLERHEFQNVLWRDCRLQRQRLERMARREDPLTFGAIFPTFSENVFKALRHSIETESAPDMVEERELSFLTENRIAELPFNRYQALMHASMAVKAGPDQRTPPKLPPNQGMSTDIRVVSTLLPYCDAMFMDNGCRAILNDIPQAYRMPEASRVYSLNRRKEFLAYLRSIKNEATSDHLAKVREVYGDMDKP